MKKEIIKEIISWILLAVGVVGIICGIILDKDITLFLVAVMFSIILMQSSEITKYKKTIKKLKNEK